jgi:hypothetical protein
MTNYTLILSELLAAAAAAELRHPLMHDISKFHLSAAQAGQSMTMSAPLGGLPAMASQFAAAAAAAAAVANKAPSEGSIQSPPATGGDLSKSSSPSETTPKKNSETGENSDDSSPPKNHGLIKARGTYYPLTAFPTSMPQGPVMSTASNDGAGDSNSGRNNSNNSLDLN